MSVGRHAYVRVCIRVGEYMCYCTGMRRCAYTGVSVCAHTQMHECCFVRAKECSHMCVLRGVHTKKLQSNGKCKLSNMSSIRSH